MNKRKKNGPKNQQQTQAKGEDITKHIEVSFLESVQGNEISITYKKKSVCCDCKGKGSNKGEKFTKDCKYCDGEGYLGFSEGLESYQFPCKICKGRGKVLNTMCKKCDGFGVIMEVVEEKVQVPKGISNGQTIKIPGKGHLNEVGGVPGDLYVKVKVKADKKF